MANSPFVLSPIGVDWEGATGSQVTISVAPADPSIILQTAEYPRGTSLAVSGGKAQFKVLSGGPNVLAITIQTVFPAVSWQLVELGSPTGSQILDTVDNSDPVPYYTSIYIKGV